MPRGKRHDKKKAVLSGAINAFEPIDDLLADLKGESQASPGTASTGHKNQTRGGESAVNNRKTTSKTSRTSAEPTDRISSHQKGTQAVTDHRHHHHHHHHTRRKAEHLRVRMRPLPRLPIDLPTEDYAAIIQTPGFPHYLDYPARTHHLKYPSTTPSSSSLSSWEDTHLHQRVSQPRINIRWTRPIEDADRRAMAHFFRFAAPDGQPLLGFRPYRDILFLDASYLAAHAAARTATHRRLGAPPDLVPFILPRDRAKVPLLAVAAGAFASSASGAELASLCGVLAREFPKLQRLLVTSIAVVDRPVNARWDLETDFAYWGCFDADGTLHGWETSAVTGPGVGYATKSAEGGVSSLVKSVEEAFARAGRDVATRREKGDKVRHGTEIPAAGRGRGKSERRYTGRHIGAVSEYESASSSLSGTGDVVRTDTRTSKAGGDKCMKDLKIEPYVLLYFRDAFHRAVENGWEPGDLISLDNMTVKMH